MWVRIGRNKYRGGACGQVMDDLPKSSSSTLKIENYMHFQDFPKSSSSWFFTYGGTSKNYVPMAPGISVAFSKGMTTNSS